MRILILCAALVVTSSAGAQARYETHDGCDVGRWSEWESIIISMDGYPDEQDDARAVREFNRELCERMDAGELTQDEANGLYDRELEAWGERMEERKAKRNPPAGVGATG